MNTARRPVSPSSATRSLAILVVGMHRSGTSLLTGILNLLGADVGKNLLGCSEENPTGFWESEEMINLHNQLLQSAGTSWDDPLAFPDAWYDSPHEPLYRRRMLDLLRADFQSSPLFVIKDPRICKLIPFWRRVLSDFGADLAAVMPVRNPIEIAVSLKKRNGFSFAKSMLLWMRYLIDAERNTRDLPRSVLSYEQLSRHWRPVMSRISHDLAITWPRQSPHATGEIEALVQPLLRHFNSHVDEVQSDPAVGSWVKSLYAACLAEERGEDGALAGAVDDIAAQARSAEQIYGSILAETAHAQLLAEQQTRQLEIKTQTLEAHAAQSVQQVRQEAENYKNMAEEARHSAVAAEDKNANLLSQIQDLELELRTVRNDLAGRRTEICRLLQQLRQNETRIQSLETDLAEKTSLAASPPQAEPLAANQGGELPQAPQRGPEDCRSTPSAAPPVGLTLVEKTARTLRKAGIKTARNKTQGEQFAAGDRELLKSTPLFDAEFYCSRYPDVKAREADAVEHYLLYGAKEGRWPHPLFDPHWYQPIDAGANQLVDFISRGGVAGRSPHLLFDSEFYLGAYPDVKNRGINPLVHYLQDGAGEGRDPHPLFSTQWYVQQYRDVAAQGINPLIHFVTCGMAEGRRTHAAFDPEFYLQRNPDVRSAGIDPLVHYLTRGAFEARNPSALFDAKAYWAAYPDIAEHRLDSLKHYLMHGIHEGREVLPVRMRRTWAEDKANTPMAEAVDVIIPAYRGLEQVRRCIESILVAAPRNATPHSIIVIDDCSPEPELICYLRELAARQKIWLLSNERNLGFVGTVNRGMDINQDRDVILLNSDTEVANGWLDRLRRAAYAEPGIATVTPFSNSATICSFPIPNVANKLPEGLGVAEVDAVFASLNTGAAVDIPTGVGFCMYVRRQALAELGTFDAEAYGKGYGEENDFCMRALSRGWRHVLAADTFVYHVGEVSFGASSGAGKQKATEILTMRYPTYEGIIRAHARSDPAARFRQNSSVAMLKRSGKPIILAISHNRGGGTEKHIRDVAALTAEKCHTLLMCHDSPGTVRISNLNDSIPLEVRLDPFEGRYELLQFLQSLNPRRIHVHHLLNNELFLPQLLELLHGQFGIPYDVTLHDFFFLAPNPHLINDDGVFIGEPDDDNAAVLLHSATELSIPASLSEWRKRHYPLLAGAQRIIAPSLDTARRFRRYFPNLQVTVAFHPENIKDPESPIMPRGLLDDEPMRMVILGALGPEKGVNVLEAVASHATRNNLPLLFHVIGSTSHKLTGRMLSNVIVHGAYKQEMLPELLERVKAHAAWFPAQCPETFCYTLGEAMRAGLPIVASDLGALGERLWGRPWSWRVRWDQTPEQWAELLMVVRDHLRRGEPPVVYGTARSGAGDFYPKEYLSWMPA